MRVRQQFVAEPSEQFVTVPERPGGVTLVGRGQQVSDVPVEVGGELGVVPDDGLRGLAVGRGA
ncbi:hypothetical protein V2I01_25990 [Micromonospora sp. BRA006-A]|nr:hypothetical protein [Micromonospora sp. BRA006-A]